MPQQMEPEAEGGHPVERSPGTVEAYQRRHRRRSTTVFLLALPLAGLSLLGLLLGVRATEWPRAGMRYSRP